MAEPRDRLFAALAPYISFDDSLRLRLVCSTFRFYCKRLGRPPPPFPWLMLPEAASPLPLANMSRSFYDIPSGRAYRYSVPGEAFHRCVASAHGWIVFAAVDAPRSLVLVNPITQRRVNVEWPFENQYIDRLHAVLTSSPLDRECLLVIASDEIIAYCRPNRGRPWTGWHTLPAPEFCYDAAASDFICVGTMVYLVDEWRDLWRVDLADPEPNVEHRCTGFSLPDGERTRHYLVESLGLVHLMLSDERYNDIFLFRMDWGGTTWVPAKNWARGRVLLLGRGCSAAVPASAAPVLAPGGTLLFAHQPSTAIDEGAMGIGGGGQVRFWTEFVATWDGLPPPPPPQPPLQPQLHGEFNASDSLWFFPAIDPDGIDETGIE